MTTGRKLAAAALAGALLMCGAGAADALPKPVKYKNCTALNKVYKGGVAKSSTVKNKGGKTRYKPTVYRAVYDLNHKQLDRDKDSIACER
jgi:hypothetical protein